MRGGYRSAAVNVLAQFSMAGFEVTSYGRIWVTPEVEEVPLKESRQVLRTLGIGVGCKV